MKSKLFLDCLIGLSFTSALFDLDDIDDCDPNLCMHGAECVDGYGDFECLCAEGFYGVLCESRKTNISLIYNHWLF